MIVVTGHRKAMQKAVLGGAYNIMVTGALTKKAMEGMKGLETLWVGLTKPIYHRF